MHLLFVLQKFPQSVFISICIFHTSHFKSLYLLFPPLRCCSTTPAWAHMLTLANRCVSPPPEFGFLGLDWSAAPLLFIRAQVPVLWSLTGQLTINIG